MRTNKERIDTVVELFRDGYNRKQIADVLHSDYRTVNRILTENLTKDELDKGLRITMATRMEKLRRIHWGNYADENRVAQIVKMWRDGMSTNQVMAEMHVSRRYLNALLKSDGVDEVLMAQHASQQLSECGSRSADVRFGSRAKREARNRRIFQMREAGATLTAIAAEVGLTPQGVADVLHRKNPQTLAVKFLRQPKPKASKTVVYKPTPRDEEPEILTRRVDPGNAHAIYKEQQAVYSQMLQCTDTAQYQKLARRYSELQMKIDYNETVNSVRRNQAVAYGSEYSVTF